MLLREGQYMIELCLGLVIVPLGYIDGCQIVHGAQCVLMIQPKLVLSECQDTLEPCLVPGKHRQLPNYAW
jgi:hypothetical protein